MDNEAKSRACQLATVIRQRRTGLANAEAQTDPNSPHYHPSYTRKGDRVKEAAVINGMVIALTYVLGSPNDMTLAEGFIQNEG